MLNFVSSGVVVVTALDAHGESTGFGSGCIVGEGLVLTNYHVLEDAVSAKIQPKGDDNERLGKEQQVVGYRAVDIKNDLVLLKVEGMSPNLHTFSVPDSDSLEQHDQVFCMGHPDGLKFSTSPGFVSGLLKTSDMPEQLQAVLLSADTEWIQTDAVISGGSSGGPLLNERGELVGINTLVLPDSRIAFAVSSSHVRELLHQKNQPVTALPMPDADVITTKSLADMKAGFDREFRQMVIDVRRLQASGDVDEVQKLIQMNNPGPVCLRRCCELAEKHKGAPEAADALKFSADVLKTSRALPNNGRQYLDELLSKATADPGLIPLSPRVINSLLGLSYSIELESFLRRLINSEQPDSLKGAAGVVLVSAMADSSDSSFKPEMLELAADIKARFGAERFRTTTIGEVLTPVLDAEKFAVGSMAPEITGADAEGKTFSLSDYRGKVVMLDFWADWCPHCRNMYAEERALVERMKDKPFALLGVNGDEPDRARGVIEAGTVTWRSWLDGSGGPIAELYQIEGWPTILVLDATGRIRFTGVRGAELEAAIESLLNDVPPTIPQDVLAENATWKYSELSQANTPDNWNQTTFDDSEWQTGKGSFAFEGQHEGGTDFSSVPPGQRPIVTLFRTTFDVSDAQPPTSQVMNIRYRDGVTVFLNGKEVYRGNLYRDSELQGVAASRASEREANGIVVPINANDVVPGSNCLAVALHQYSAYSAAPLLSLTMGRMPNLLEGIESLPPGEKSKICRIIAQAGTEVPGASAILEKLQTDASEAVRVSAAAAAAMNGFPVAISDLSEPEAHQNLFSQVMQLNSNAWAIVESAKFTPGQYADALRMVSASHALKLFVHEELKSEVRGIDNTMGVALYRNGQYEKAIEKLQKSIELEGENPVDVAFVSLAHFKLGDKEQSRKGEALFRELLKKEEWQHSALALQAQKELIAGLSE